MSPKPHRIHYLVFAALQAMDTREFSTRDLRDAYLRLASDVQKVDPNDLRKYLYKQVIRLKKIGVVEQRKGAHRRDIKFLVSTPKALEQLKQIDGPMPFAILKGDNERQSGPKEKSIDIELQERLKQHQVELMSSVGEAEEYMSLYKAYPEFRSQLEKQYLASRDRSSKLLGQVRAIETMIAEVTRSSL